MAQIFSHYADSLFRLILLGVLLGLAAAVFAWRSVIARSNGVGEPVEQPIPFSHKHHVADDGLDCRYCHTTVDRAAFAGLPATETCMTCHSQLFVDQPLLKPLRDSLQSNRPIRWKRVNALPDFVYFNHGIHVDNGVGCVTCHGQVDSMPLTWRAKPLTMKWCVSCHRQPEPHLRPKEAVFDMRWRPPANRLALGQLLLQRYHIDKRRLTDCSVCHR